MILFLLALSLFVNAAPFIHAHEGASSSSRNQGGSLPIPPAPPVSMPPFEQVATGDRQVDAIISRMLTRIPTFNNYRGNTHGAIWEERQANIPTLTRSADCLDQLTAQGISFINVSQLDENKLNSLPLVQQRLLRRNYDHYIRNLATPVLITGPFPTSDSRGVELVPIAPGRLPLFTCAMTLELARFAQVLHRKGFNKIGLMSAHRTQPRESFHTMGLAIDVAWLEDSTTKERYSVSRDYLMTPRIRTCGEEQAFEAVLRTRNSRVASRALRLQDLICTVFRQQIFSTVITPNYNEGHRDHFHLDVRPFDNRLFLR